MKKIKDFDTFLVENESAKSLGEYYIDDDAGNCHYVGKDANHDFSKKDFDDWENSVDDYIGRGEEIEDLIIDAIYSQLDDIEDTVIIISNRKHHITTKSISFDWDINKG